MVMLPSWAILVQSISQPGMIPIRVPFAVKIDPKNHKQEATQTCLGLQGAQQSAHLSASAVSHFLTIFLVVED